MADSVLLVEPDSRLRSQIAAFFGTRGFLVTEVGSVGGALSALRGFSPDLALLNTPLDEDAVTVAFAVRRNPRAALVVMGQPAALDDFRAAIGYEIRPQAYLEKPFTAKSLAGEVDAALRSVREAASVREEARQASAQLGDEVGALAQALAALGPKSDPQPPPPPSPPSGPVADPAEPTLTSPPAGVAAMDTGEEALTEQRFMLSPMTAGNPSDPQGIYGPVTMAELLLKCFRDLYTGRITLRRGDVWKTVRMVSGRPVQAASNVATENLGALLVAARRLTPDQNRESLEAVQRGAGRHGEVLVQMGVLSRAGLRAALRDQLRVRLMACFRWTSAEYGLGYDPQVGASGDDLEVNPLELIFEGLRQAAPIEPLVRHFDGATRRFLQTTEKFNDYKSFFREHPEAIEVAYLCDGHRVLAEVVVDSPLGLIDTLRVVRALEVMGCVTVGDVRPLGAVRNQPTSAPPRWARPASGSSTGEFTRPAWAGAAGGSMEAVPRRVVTSRPAEARPPEPSEPPASRRPGTSTSPSARHAPVERPTGGYRVSRPATQSSGAPPAARPDTSGSFRAVVRPTGSQPPERPSVSGMRPTGSRTSGPGAPQEGSIEMSSPSAQLRGEIERIERAENLYEVMGLSTSAPLRAVRDQSQRLLRLLNADQVVRIDESLLDRARIVARRVAEATETLGNRQPRETYDALQMPVGAGGRGVDLLAAEANFAKGQVCMQHNLAEKAFRFFNLAVEQDPHQPLYRVYQAAALFAQTPADDRRNRTKSLDDAREALEEVAGRDDAWVMVGEMALAVGALDQAGRLFGRALEVNSGNARAREALQTLERGEQPVAKTADNRGAGLLNKLFSRR